MAVGVHSVAAGAPTAGTTWPGINDEQVTPPDANGAIGPNSYFETVNDMVALSSRVGAPMAVATFASLTGDSGGLSDPMTLWDPNTQRFYYNILNVDNNHMDWGFSMDANPTAIPGSFCNYSTDFSYPSGSLADYPKLGQTKNFLMIGVNVYLTPTSPHSEQSDLLWIQKPQGSAPITTCPAPGTFGSGKFANLKNQGGSEAWTPVPAIQTDPSPKGYIVASSDIECPDVCGTGTLLTVYRLQPKKGNPSVPTLSKPHSITVPGFQSPSHAPQPNPQWNIDTLDGRLTHAVSGVDPSFGKVAIWVAHTVKGGAGSEIRWYEIKPVPATTPTLADSGTVSDPSLWVYDAGISTDRTCTATACAHGDAMVLGFTTSSATALPAIEMVSKVGTNPQSAMVLVTTSTATNSDFGCPLLGYCRWGDYGGATPDPAAPLTGTTGEVWLTNQWTNGSDKTWNWEAHP
jgi:hypothetical protein